MVTVHKIIFISMALPQVGFAKPVPAGSWPSPSGELSLEVTWDNDGQAFRIINRRTGRPSKLIRPDSLVLAAKWTDDSTAVMLVEHLAGCSLGRVISVQNGRWSIEDAYPSKAWDRFCVIQMESRKHRAIFTYRVERNNYAYVGKCTVNCNLRFHNTTDTAIRLSRIQWDKLQDPWND
jgi:hypothetical protein